MQDVLEQIYVVRAQIHAKQQNMVKHVFVIVNVKLKEIVAVITLITVILQVKCTMLFIILLGCFMHQLEVPALCAKSKSIFFHIYAVILRWIISLTLKMMLRSYHKCKFSLKCTLCLQETISTVCFKAFKKFITKEKISSQIFHAFVLFTYSLICQGTSTKRQRSRAGSRLFELPPSEIKLGSLPPSPNFPKHRWFQNVILNIRRHNLQCNVRYYSNRSFETNFIFLTLCETVVLSCDLDLFISKTGLQIM